jgi:hypothetical protein
MSLGLARTPVYLDRRSCGENSRASATRGAALRVGCGTVESAYQEAVMLRIIIVTTLLAALVTGLFAGARMRAQRRRAGNSELNKHPERLDQMLDPTDDA